MLISSEQLSAIAAGELVYVSCDWCGQHSEIAPVESRIECPHCRNICDESGKGYDFGFMTDGNRKYGLNYEINAGDYQSGY